MADSCDKFNGWKCKRMDQCVWNPKESRCRYRDLGEGREEVEKFTGKEEKEGKKGGKKKPAGDMSPPREE